MMFYFPKIISHLIQYIGRYYAELDGDIFQIIFSFFIPILRIGYTTKQFKRRMNTNTREYGLSRWRVYTRQLPKCGLNKVLNAGKNRDEFSQSVPVGIYGNQILFGYS